MRNCGAITASVKNPVLVISETKSEGYATFRQPRVKLRLALHCLMHVNAKISRIR